MTRTSTGWLVLIAAVGMMLGLTALDISKLASWDGMTAPAFVATVMGHFATVIAAFVAGKIIPIDPQEGGRRGTDPNNTHPDNR